MRTVPYRRWSPPASPLRIEIPEELLGELRSQPDSPDSSGSLYGLRCDREVRVLSAGPGKDLEKVGIFVSRIRGEVFLTEADLDFFERENSGIALVVAGDRAGFFVREFDGSIQTVRSHEEFAVADPPATRAAAALFPAPPVRKWTWAAAALVALGLPVAALAYLRPVLPAPPLGLQAREESGELHISWNPGQAAVLAIKDGGERIAVLVPPDEAKITYQPNSREIEIGLTAAEASQHPRRETILFELGRSGPKRER